MCESCWAEYGKPQIDNPKVREAAAIAHAFADRDLYYGNLHIITDDWNIEDKDLDFCQGLIDFARSAGVGTSHEIDEFGHSEPDIVLEQQLLTAMRSMSLDERASALALIERYWTPQPKETANGEGTQG